MTRRIVGIHQPQYLPYLGFFHKISRSDVFVLLDDVQFQKGGFQNRNRIKSVQGWQWITVPVLHDSKQLISEVRINKESPWQRKHTTTLKTNYTSAPFFSLFMDELEDILNRDWDGINNLNVELISWAMKALGIGTKVILSSSLEHTTSGATERLVRICQQIEASTYLSGPGGKNYMDLDAFSAAGIEVIWQEFESPVYEQVFPEAGFQSDLSVVDALFSCGPDAGPLLA